MKATNATGIDHPKLDPEVRTLLEAGSAMPDVLPPAFVVTAGCDPLCSEGEASSASRRSAAPNRR